MSALPFGACVDTKLQEVDLRHRLETQSPSDPPGLDFSPVQLLQCAKSARPDPWLISSTGTRSRQTRNGGGEAGSAVHLLRRRGTGGSRTALPGAKGVRGAGQRQPLYPHKVPPAVAREAVQELKVCYDCGELAQYPDLRNNCRWAYLLQVPASFSYATGQGPFLS